MERFIENTMYASRWLLAPIYFGLSLALLALALKFFQEVYHILPQVFALEEATLILKLLSLIDMALVGGLLVMVMISGYENFVSQLDIDDNKEKLNWLGTMDSSSLKMKVAASIVAISSIHLLRIFMDAKNVDPQHLMWYSLLQRIPSLENFLPVTGLISFAHHSLVRFSKKFRDATFQLLASPLCSLFAMPPTAILTRAIFPIFPA